MIIIKLNRIIKLKSVWVAFADSCCGEPGVADGIDVRELKQISLKMFQLFIHRYFQKKKKRIQMD
jgi:hypothetical protein